MRNKFFLFLALGTVCCFAGENSEQFLKAGGEITRPCWCCGSSNSVSDVSIPEVSVFQPSTKPMPLNNAICLEELSLANYSFPPLSSLDIEQNGEDKTTAVKKLDKYIHEKTSFIKSELRSFLENSSICKDYFNSHSFGSLPEDNLTRSIVEKLITDVNDIYMEAAQVLLIQLQSPEDLFVTKFGDQPKSVAFYVEHDTFFADIIAQALDQLKKFSDIDLLRIVFEE
jgi:hypothetical protein